MELQIHIHQFPANKHVRLFHVAVHNNLRAGHVVTNDMTQTPLDTIQEEYGIQFNIEEVHRELKQTTDIEKCQCRRSHMQKTYRHSFFNLGLLKTISLCYSSNYLSIESGFAKKLSYKTIAKSYYFYSFRVSPV